MPRTEQRTFSFNIDGGPAVIIVRFAPMPWRKCVLPTLKAICADIMGRPVVWRDIHVFEGMDDEDWNRLTMSGRFPMYVADAPGTFSKVAG